MAKILIVDDDPDFVSVVKSVLVADGHEIGTAANGDQAIRSMKKNKPDLVLLDIMMSYVLDGLDVSRRIAEDPELKGTPVLLVTSLTATPDSGMFPTDEDIPVDGWITKPVDPAKLKAQITSLLARD
jgi:two-component system alkaline phosphatase synthesis response regulator PhoP